MTKGMGDCAPVFLALLLVAGAGTAGCGGGVCHGAECTTGSTGSGNFTKGPFPHSAIHLDGARCHTGGAVIQLFPTDHLIFTDPDPPTTVRMADPLTVYWSVCNVGMEAASGQSEAYTLSRTLRGPPDDTVGLNTYAIPPLAACTCDVQSRVFQNELAPGSYTFSLDGAVTGSIDRNINP